MRTRPRSVHLVALGAGALALAADAVLWWQVTRVTGPERAAWVTASAAVAVGVVGFVGAWLGAWRSHLHAVQESAVEARRDAYAEFLAHVADLLDLVDAILATADPPPGTAAAARATEHHERYGASRAEARRVVARIELLGSARVYAAALDVLDRTRTQVGSAEGADPQERRRSARAALDAGVDDYLSAARHDLGIQ